MAFSELVSIALAALVACAYADSEKIVYKQVRCKAVGNQTTGFMCEIPPCASGYLPCCSSQDLTQGTDMLFWAEPDVDPHCYVTRYQYTSGNSTVQILTRSFSNYTCLTTCDSYQSLAALYNSSSNSMTLNYFRCFTFEGGNYDDVSNEGSSSNVVCKTDWSGTAAGIAVITILSVIGFVLLLALVVGLAILVWCAIKGCRKGRSERARGIKRSPPAAGSYNFAAFPHAQENEPHAQENEPHAQENEPQAQENQQQATKF